MMLVLQMHVLCCYRKLRKSNIENCVANRNFSKMNKPIASFGQGLHLKKFVYANY